MLANPFFTYTTVWLFTLFLYSLKVTTNILDLNQPSYTLFLGAIIIFALNYLISKLLYKTTHNNSIKGPNENIVVKIQHLTKKLFTFWLSITFIEVVLFGGIPFINVVILGDNSKNYQNFGLPTLHGFLNACYFSLFVLNFILYKLTNNKKYVIIIIGFLIWAFLLMTRALFLIAFSQLLCTYLLTTKIKIKQILRVFVFIIGIIVLFGWIGDNRMGSGEESITSGFVDDDYKAIAEKIPSGFIWVYLYVTTPINNIVWNIDNLKPTYTLKNSTKGLIPSVIRDRIFTEDAGNKYSLDLYESSFNVSSYFVNYLADVGIWGTLLIVGIFQLVVLNRYFSALTHKVGSIVSYATLYNAIFLSIFFDFFFSLITILQVVLGLYINRQLYGKPQIQR